MSKAIGTERQVDTALDVLLRLSEEREGDGQLRDAIAVVRHELNEIQDAR